MTLVDPTSEILHSHEATLNEEFKLHLGNHELVNPTTNRGEVVDIVKSQDIVNENGEKICDVYEVEVKDPFVDSDPAGYEIVRSYVERMEEHLVKDGVNPLIGHRHEATSHEERNEYTRAWTGGTDTAVSIWRDLVPTAEALGYLTNPNIGQTITNREGDSAILSQENALQLRFVDDAIAIRDRAVAMQEIAEVHLAELRKETNKVRWLSLASGTAEPAIAAAKAAQLYAEQDGDSLDVDLTVADYDVKALKYVRKNAERYDFGGNVTTIVQNILAPTLREDLAEATSSNELYDVVENMGFEEYLPQKGDELQAFKGEGLPQASEFTKNAFDLVKPGGILISGNMVLDRPQLGFVFGIVDWPIINARSEESILRVYKEAGIIDNPNAKVEMFRVRNSQTSAHVYNIVKVTKLA